MRKYLHSMYYFCCNPEPSICLVPRPCSLISVG
jgi:hypothetical protein